MNGKFIASNEQNREPMDWGELGWISQPLSCGCSQLTTIEATLLPGKGHDFHRHPGQEETIYIVEGIVEQWLEDEMRIMHAGDTVFIGSGIVHASFNMGETPAKIFVALGPCVGDSGYNVVEVADEAPWNSLRK